MLVSEGLTLGGWSTAPGALRPIQGTAGAREKLSERGGINLRQRSDKA